MAAAVQQPVTQPTPTADEGVVAKLGGKVRHWKDQATSTQKELEVARKELLELKAKVQDPDETTKELARVKQQVRDRAAFDKFAELAKTAGAKEAAIKHLWKLAEYQADKDEPDEAKLSELLTGLKAEADFAFDPPEDPASARAAEIAKARSGLELRQTPEAAGGGRSSRNKGGDGTLITAEMRADPKFMLDPRNKEIIAAAAREGRFR